MAREEAGMKWDIRESVEMREPKPAAKIETPTGIQPLVGANPIARDPSKRKLTLILISARSIFSVLTEFFDCMKAVTLGRRKRKRNILITAVSV